MDLLEVSLHLPETSLHLPEASLHHPEASLHHPEARFGLPEASLSIPEAIFDLPEASMGLPKASLGLPEAILGLPEASRKHLTSRYRVRKLLSNFPAINSYQASHGSPLNLLNSVLGHQPSRGCIEALDELFQHTYNQI